MGISILLIMLFHVNFLACGFIGVEFFLLISAVGLFFSLKKNQHLQSFYRRRILRILPTYFLVAIPYFIYLHRQDLDIKDFFIDLSGLCIFQDERYFWFILLILICYLIAPFYNRLLRFRYSIAIPFITLVACYCLGLCFPALAIMLNRFAIFFLGFHLAELVYRKQKIHGRMILPACLLAVLLIPCVELLPVDDGLKIVAYFFQSIPALMLLIIILKCSPGFIIKSLAFLGGITLELYMIHEKIHYRFLEGAFGYLVGGIISFPIAIVLAYLLNKLTSKLLPK